jgi:hypothetical protein
MNSIESHDLANLIGDDLAKQGNADPVRCPLGAAWNKMTEKEQALQKLQWIILLLKGKQ